MCSVQLWETKSNLLVLLHQKVSLAGVDETGKIDGNKSYLLTISELLSDENSFARDLTGFTKEKIEEIKKFQKKYNLYSVEQALVVVLNGKIHWK